MSVSSVLLFALLAGLESASENAKPLVEHLFRIGGHVKCAGVPVENATVSLVFALPNPGNVANSDELTSVNGPEAFLNYGSSAVNLLNDSQPASSGDYVIANDTEAGEVPTGYYFPDNNTDSTFYDGPNRDPVGDGASLASEENVTATTDDDSPTF